MKLINGFLKDSVVNVTGALLIGLMGYGFHFLISRFLSIQEYGELQSLLSLFAIVSGGGSVLVYFVVKHVSGYASLKDYSSNRQFIKFLNLWLKRVGFILVILFLCSVPLLKKILDLSNYWGILIIGATALLAGLKAVYEGQLRGWKKFLPLNLINFLAHGIKLAIGFLAALILPKAFFVSISLLFSAFLGWLMAFAYSFKKFKLKSAKKEKVSTRFSFNKNFFSSLKPTFIFTVLLITFQNVDVLLVKAFTTPEITGHWGALSLIGKIILWINLAIIGTFLPDAITSVKKHQKIAKKVILNAYFFIFCVGLIAISGYYLFPKFIILTLFGEKYLQFANILWLFGVLAMSLSLLSLEVNFSFAKNNFRISYLLAATLIGMGLAVYFNHDTLTGILTGFIISSLLGYFGALLLNSRLEFLKIFIPGRHLRQADQSVAQNLPKDLAKEPSIKS